MVAVLKPPTAGQAPLPRSASVPPVRLPRPSSPPTSTSRTRRRPSAQRFPQLGFAAAGGSAVLRVAGNGLLDVADNLAYAALDRADDAALRTGPLRLLGLGPATVARLTWTSGSDLAHDLLMT